MDRSLITKGKFMTSGGIMHRPPARDRPASDNIDELRERLERVQKAMDFIRGEDPNENRGDRIQWLLDRGYI